LRFDHDERAKRQGEKVAGENPVRNMSETQLAAVNRLEERLEALKERL